MVLIKWVEWKKGTEVKEFKKVFRIPEIVKLDKIKARFNEEDGTLTVTLPKKVKGISGLKIVEEEEVEEITLEKTEPEEEKMEEITEPEEEIKEETKPEEKEEEEEEPMRQEEEEENIKEEVMEEEEPMDHEEDKEEIEEDSKPRKWKRKKCCFPFVAGSTLLMSIIVFIIQLIQSKRK